MPRNRRPSSKAGFKPVRPYRPLRIRVTRMVLGGLGAEQPVASRLARTSAPRSSMGLFALLGAVDMALGTGYHDLEMEYLSLS